METAGNAIAFDVEIMAYCVSRVACSVLDFGNLRFEIVGVDQRFGLGLLDQADALAPMQTPVECGVNRAEFAARLKQIEVLDAVTRENRDAVAFVYVGNIV